LVVSSVFRTFGLGERRPALAQAVMAMFRYLLVDHAVPAMCRSRAAARLRANCALCIVRVSVIR
jgi:hypothetical protein